MSTAKKTTRSGLPKATSKPEYRSQDFKNGALPAHSSNNINGEAVTSMPRSLIAALPVSTIIMHHVREIEKLRSELVKQMQVARDNGAPSVARAWVVLYKMSEIMMDALAISSENGKPFKDLRKQYSETEIPQVFEQAGVDFIPLAEGFQVGVSNTFRASMVKENKDKAYQWLREHGLGDLITSTVNASTLSAAARKEVEDKNVEFPDDLFKVGYVPTVSVTGTK